jgi:RNA polymerase sigma-70 factor (ECF subfamily)
LQHLRKKKHQVVLEDVHPDPSPGPEKLTESQLKLQNVQRVLQTFPETERAAFLLRVYHELPYAEIARVLELSLTAIKVKVYRVRRKLIASCIEKEDYLS